MASFSHLCLLVFVGVSCVSSLAWFIFLLLLFKVLTAFYWVLFRFSLLWLYCVLGSCSSFKFSPMLFLAYCSFHVSFGLCVILLPVGCEGFQVHGFGVMLSFPNVKMLQVPRLAFFPHSRMEFRILEPLCECATSGSWWLVGRF